MNRWHFDQRVDLKGGAGEVIWPNALMLEGDHQAHAWQVQVRDGVKAVDLSQHGITAYFQRMDGKTVVVTGSADGDTATVVLPQSVYAVPGQLLGVMRASSGGSKITLAAGRWTVRCALGDDYILPDKEIIDLPALLGKIAEMESATNAANAAVSGAVEAKSAALTAAEEAREAAAGAEEAMQAASQAAQGVEEAAQAAAEAAQAANDARETLASETAEAKNAATAAAASAEEATASAADAATTAKNASESAAAAQQAAAAASEKVAEAVGAASDASSAATNANEKAALAASAAEAATAAAQAADEARAGIQADLDTLRDGKLDKTPGTWPAWTAEEQAQARTSIAALAAADYAPVDKTDSMTQPVGRDADGKLWTEASSGGAGAADAVLYTMQNLTEDQQEQARGNIGSGTKIIKRTDTMPDHDGLPLTGKTITLRGSMFTNAHNYVTDAENLIPYPYSFKKASPRLGISFINTARLLHVYGTSTATGDGVVFTDSVPLPENVAPGDKLTLYVFTLNLCTSSFLIRIQFLNASGNTIGKLNCYCTDYENSGSMTVPDDAVSMNAMIKFPNLDESVDTILMPVLLRADDTVEQYDPLAEGSLLTIPTAFDGVGRLSAFPCDLRVEYPMRTQPYIDEDRSCVTPEAFGAEGNGNTDDTAAMQAALAWAQAKGIAFRAYRKYKTTDTLHITEDGADVEIHELIYLGADAAIQIENSNVQLTTHIVRSSGSGVVLRSDSSPILNCIYHLGEVHASGNAFGVVLTNYPISIQQVYFSVLDAGKVGDCVNYNYDAAVDGTYCGEFMYYGGIAKHGVWAFNGLMGTTKMFNVDIENNVNGGINLKGAIYAYGLRITEDLRDLPGPFLRIYDTTPTGILSADHPVDLNKIDLSDAIDWYKTDNSDTQKTLYASYRGLRIDGGVSNTVRQTAEGNKYWSASHIGRTADIVGKKILIYDFAEVQRVITDAEFDMSANGFSYDFAKMIPTIYVAGAEHSTVRLHPSFASYCRNTVTVVQTDTEKIVMYDCEGHLVFDGSIHGAGTYRLRAYHDYDDNGEIEYAYHLPLIDYSREKWMIENT